MLRSGAKGPKAVRSREDDRVAVKVTFVVFKGEVNAIFRAVKGYDGAWMKDGPFVNRCDGHWRYNAYAHVGQHCEVDAALLKCRRATREEYAPLLKEMRDIVGYDVEVVQRGRLRLREETGYACVYLDEHDGNCAGVYKVFRSRAEALDYLTDTVFERAKILEVEVVDVSGKLEKRDGCTCYPLMTWEQVRDRLGSGMDFSLVLDYDGMMNPVESAVMGIREVTVK